jgi:nucleotide-binding universal stress UspA family protein
VTVVTDVRLDPAADGVLTAATAHQADLIVMSTHGRGGLGRWVYGSVADRILRAAELPILLVRAGINIEGETTIPLPATTNS